MSTTLQLKVIDGLRRCRIDEWAGVCDAHTAQPGRMALDSSVFRGMSSLEAAKQYADSLSERFKDLGAPEAVFVVAGPTSTTKMPFEVVSATAGYSVLYRTRPQWGKRLASLMRATTRETRSFGLQPDPVAQDIGASRYVGGLEREIRRLGIGDLDTATVIGAGASSIALALGEKVVRVGLGPLPDRPAIPEVLQAEMAGTIGNLRYEVLPRADAASVTAEHLEAIQISLAMRGYEWPDAGLDNIGLIDGSPVIFDSHGIQCPGFAVSHAPSPTPSGCSATSSATPEEGIQRNPLIQALLEQKEVHGLVLLPGVTHSDIVGVRGGSVAIYGWSGDHTGRTRGALQVLLEYGNGHLEVHDPGEPGSSSRGYWEKMAREGLVTELYDELGERIELADPIAASVPKPRRPRL